jgi:hypothetical protein
MASDETVARLHHLDDVHLIAVGRLAGVFPGQAGAVGEEAGAKAGTR